MSVTMRFQCILDFLVKKKVCIDFSSGSAASFVVQHCIQIRNRIGLSIYVQRRYILRLLSAIFEIFLSTNIRETCKPDFCSLNNISFKYFNSICDIICFKPYLNFETRINVLLIFHGYVDMPLPQLSSYLFEFRN